MDEKVRHYLGGVISNEEIDEKFNHFKDHWIRHGFGLWSVIDEKSNEVIGLCGLHHSDDGIELSYMFFPSSWGRGLAREAAQASIEFGFNTLKLVKLSPLLRRLILDRLACWKS